MNELLKDKLAVLAGDEITVGALRAVFNEVIEKEKPVIGKEPNDVLGGQYRAYIEGKCMIDNAFRELLSYKVEKKQVDNFNKGR